MILSKSSFGSRQRGDSVLFNRRLIAHWDSAEEASAEEASTEWASVKGASAAEAKSLVVGCDAMVSLGIGTWLTNLVDQV